MNKIFTTLNEPLGVQIYSLVTQGGEPLEQTTLEGLPLGTVGNVSDGELAAKVIIVENRGAVGDVVVSTSAKATAGAPTYAPNADSPFSQNLSGDLRVIAKQVGTWTVTGAGGTFPVTGTFWQAIQPVLASANSSTVAATLTQVYKVVASAGTPETLGTGKFECVTIKARKNRTTANTGSVFYGYAAGNDTQLGELSPGEEKVFMAPDGKKIDLSLIYLDVVTDGDGVLIETGN
jgi:hypothetical protein